MKKSNLLVYSLLCLSSILISGCASKSTPGTKTSIPKDQKTDLSKNYIDDRYKNYYQVLVYSYADSNGDGIGDLNGLIAKLDYLNNGKNDASSLGVDGLYTLPIFKSSSYHKYDVIDYKTIDPTYGTLDDFKYLINECNARGISVILDLPINHTSSSNKWFTESKRAIKALTTSDYDSEYNISEEFKKNHPYLDYYNWVHKSKVPASGKYEAFGDGTWYYEAYFTGNMPDLNLDNVKVQQEIKDILKYWFDLGVYGFRLDGVEHYYDSSVSKTYEFCDKLYDWCREIKGSDKFYLVGEGPWSSTVADYYSNTKIPSYMNFYYGNYNSGVLADRSVINNIFVNESSYSLKINKFADEYTVDENGDLYSGEKLNLLSSGRYYEKIINNWKEINVNANPNAVDAQFLTNHDTNREANVIITQRLDDDTEQKEDRSKLSSLNQQRLKMAWATSHLLNGSTFTYYGEEIGMAAGTQYAAGTTDASTHNDPNKRHPMYWSTTDTSMNVNINKIPGAQSCDPYLAPADEQVNDKGSVWNFFREMFKMKKYYPEIARGTQDIIYAKGDVAIMKKTYNDSTIYLAYNFGRAEQDLSLSDLELDNVKVKYVLTTDQTYSNICKAHLYLPDYSVTILK